MNCYLAEIWDFNQSQGEEVYNISFKNWTLSPKRETIFFESALPYNLVLKETGRVQLRTDFQQKIKFESISDWWILQFFFRKCESFLQKIFTFLSKNTIRKESWQS